MNKQNKYNIFANKLREGSQDPYGTQISIKELQSLESADIFVSEPNSRRRKMIGNVINTSDCGLVYRKKEKETDKHRNTLSWTIHKWIFNYVDLISYKTTLGTYTITSEKAKEIGFTMKYKNNNQGYMTKHFVKCRDWNLEPVNQIDQKRIDLIGYEWYQALRSEFNTAYMKELGIKISNLRTKTTVYPSANEVFNAYKLTPFMDVKVVIIGHSPYYDGSAHGLAFSMKDNKAESSPTLQNIHKELEDDYYSGGLMLGSDVNLEHWASQGVFLLNSVLTIEKNKPDAHKNFGWHKFTEATIKSLMNRPNNNKTPIVFMLWGLEAQKYESIIDSSKHLILKASHPSPFTVNKGFFGSKHFTKCNNYLLSTSQIPISW